MLTKINFIYLKNSMNTFDIIKELSKQKNLNEKDAHTIISTIIDEITQTLQLGDRIEFRGLWCFLY